MYQKIDDLLARIVPGKTFVDVGPLWGTIYEKVSVAHHYGAREISAVDTFPIEHDLWNAFFTRLRQLHISGVKWHSAHVNEIDDTYDVVYCSGVIYHQPDPFSFVRKLHEMTKEHLVLKSTISPLVPEGGCLFLPALTEEQRKIHAEDWKMFLNRQPAAGLSTRIEEWRPNCWDWWWLFSEQFLVALCRISGFVVLSHEKVGVPSGVPATQREVLIHAVKRRILC